MKPSVMSRKQLESNLHKANGINQRLNTMVRGLLLEYGDETGKLVVLKSTLALIEPGDHFTLEDGGLTEAVFRFVKAKEKE